MNANQYSRTAVSRLPRWGVAVGAVAVMMAMTGVASAQDAQARYQAERAACERLTNETSRQACLQEAGAALAEARRGNDLRTGSDAQLQANQMRRCDRLPPEQREACMMLRQSPDVQVRGSVEGGGVFRELRVIEYGDPVPVTELENQGATQSGAMPGSPAPGGAVSTGVR